MVFLGLRVDAVMPSLNIIVGVDALAVDAPTVRCPYAALDPVLFDVVCHFLHTLVPGSLSLQHGEDWLDMVCGDEGQA